MVPSKIQNGTKRDLDGFGMGTKSSRRKKQKSDKTNKIHHDFSDIDFVVGRFWMTLVSDFAHTASWVDHRKFLCRHANPSSFCRRLQLR